MCRVCWTTGRGRLTNFVKINLVGVVRTHIHTDTYTCDKYIYVRFRLHTGCGAFREVYQSGALLLVRVESPISQHKAALLGWVKPRCPRRFCRHGGDVLVQVFPRSKILIANFNRVAWSNRRLNLLPTIIGHTLGLHLVLERVESPGSQHTVVLLGCVEQSEAESVANSYRNTPIEG